MRPEELRLRLRNYARSQPSKQWFNIVNSSIGPTKISIYDEIGFFGVTAQDFCDQLNDIAGDIELYLNSPGGEIFDGITIYNALLRRSPTILIDGLAASAGSFIAQAAAPGRLGIAKTGRMMIHNGMAFTSGDASELRKMADILDGETRNIAGIYADRAGKTAEYWLDKMSSETWLGAKDAVAEGLADYVYDPRTGPTNILFRRGDVKNDNGHGHSGSCRDPDNDGDCDLTPEGDTDHDYWDEDGNQIKEIPPKSGSKKKQKKKAAASAQASFWNAKYDSDDRDRMAKSGEAMPDGSYPIADSEDLDNAVRAVGRSGTDHDEIRRHVIKRAASLKLESKIPDNWNSDGSLKDSADVGALSALLETALRG